MRQIAENAQGGPVRLQPVPLRPRPADPLPCRLPAPGARPGIARRPRPLEALVGLCRLLFVVPIGRRAREERLSGLSDRTLCDIGMRRADVHAATWGRVPLRQVMPRCPGDGRVVACARRGPPLSLVWIGEAA